MPLTQIELERFHDFAKARVGRASLEDCLREWRRMSEEDEVLADVQQGMREFASGLARPLDDVMGSIRREAGMDLGRK